MFRWNILRARQRRKTGWGNMREPGDAVVGQSIAQKSADLFPPLLKTRPNERFCLCRENIGGSFPDEVQQVGVDIGPREKTAGLDLMAGGDGVCGLQENG